MAGLCWCAIGFAVMSLAPAEGAPGPVSLGAAARVGESARTVVTLRAEGTFLEEVPQGGSEKAQPPRPRRLKVETRTEFSERVLAIDAGGRAQRVARWVSQAASALNGEIRTRATAIRPEVALLIAERRGESVVVFSPAGPLTRAELEVVEVVGDPLALAGVLPERPVAVGDQWRVGSDAARGLSGYDALAANTLDASLEALDAASALIRLRGDIRGAVLGGTGTIGCDGTLRLDRAAGQITRLELTRRERRKAGPVEEGLDITSTLTVERQSIPAPAELADAVVAALPRDDVPARELLVLIAPESRYSLTHDRDWHLYWDDPRLTVLKRLDHGEVVAQCNVNVGPKVPPGKHQDVEQFRDDVRRALGARFVQFIGAGTVDGDPAGGFRYKVAVEGKQGDVGIRWDYYLIAGPEGDQVLATFTHALAQDAAFGDQDLRLIASFRWGGPTAGAPAPAAAAP
jgi:hypothetical protein